MYSLKEGILLKLVEEMKGNINGDGCESESKAAAALLQIRSIIPFLEEGDLWPNRGFFLKVSDASHALYVSLSKQQNDMILSNKLHLGQLIHVTRLEDAAPLPILRGVAPIPGRRPCEGTPQDIISPPLPFLTAAASSDSEPSSRRSSEGWRAGRARSSTPSAKPRPKRRSWSESEIFGGKGIFDSSPSLLKQDIKLPRSASANVSPIHTPYDSSDDSSSTVSRSRVGVSGKRVTKGSSRSDILPATKANNLQTSLHSLCNVVCDRKGAESRISWTSLPSNLVNHGKEVIRQRDLAVQAAADALQEACASERLLSSLSTMSQFPLGEGDDLQPFVDKFFNLQNDLAQTSLILQSLTCRTQESESCTTSCVQDPTSIALERKKNANAWIKSAIALDLSTCLSPQTTPPGGPTRTSPSSGRCTKPRGRGCTNIRRNNNKDTNVEIPLVLAFDKEDIDEAEMRRGSSSSTMCAAAELATSLEEECKKVLLMNVDKYLDELERKSSLTEYDEHRMAGMMYKVKMVSDWLNSSVKKDGKEEGEAYARARDKIYAILLKHVERTAAVAFDRCKASI